MSKPLTSSFVDRSRSDRRAELARLAKDRHTNAGLIFGISLLFNGSQTHADYVAGLDTNRILPRLTNWMSSAPWDLRWNSKEPAIREKALPSLKQALIDAAPVETHQEKTAEERRQRRRRNHRDFAGILAQIDKAAIAALALDIFKARHDSADDSSQPTLPLPRVGGPSFGSAHVFYPIKFGNGTRWLLKIPIDGTPDTWDKQRAESLRAEALTLNMLRTETGVPVPEIIDADCSPHNDLHAPYLLTELVPGRTLDRVWFGLRGDDAATTRQRRTKVLNGLARAMAQLGRYAFARGGAPVFDGDGVLVDVGPLRVLDVQAMVDRWLEDEDGERAPVYASVGPFDDAARMRTAMLERQACGEEPCVAVDRLLRLLLGCVREPGGREGEGFVLTHPGLGMRDVIVADDGEVRGITGWDGVRAAPRSVGNEALPPWLVRDFNPFVWRWEPPAPGKKNGGEEEGGPMEDAPWVLRELRDEYAGIMQGLREQRGEHVDVDVDVTRQSLLALSLDAAARDPRCKSAVLRRVLEKCSRPTEEFSFGRLVEELEDGGQLDGYRQRCLEKNLRELVDRGYVRGAAVW
ncbi:hypothetical protein GGR52DRAFT_592295 [Hypoxylon sp. FL1284]|nr:hypothetical protein GGR52DRAFT_592295 [Hypoxylon sp. FL1284]